MRAKIEALREAYYASRNKKSILKRLQEKIESKYHTKWERNGRSSEIEQKQEMRETQRNLSMTPGRAFFSS